jgi:hypothetical protein
MAPIRVEIIAIKPKYFNIFPLPPFAGSAGISHGLRPTPPEASIITANLSVERRRFCLRCNLVENGTKQPIRNVRYSVAIEGKADLCRTVRDKRD